MRLKIGFIGAKDTLEILEEVAKEYKEEIDVLMAPYEKKEETVELVDHYIGGLDALIFSGQIPYKIAKKHRKIEIPALYMPHRGTSIYQTLWKMKEDGGDLERVSFDNVSKREIKEIYHDLGMESPQVFVKEYQENLSYQQWANYHKALYDQGKISTAITCLRETCEILQGMGVPTYRVLITKPLARQVIESAIYEAKSRKLRKNQLAVVVVNIDDFKKEIKHFPSEYGVQKLKLEFHRLLLDYAEETKGAIFSMGSDEFLIFTTSGALESSTEGFQESPLMERIRQEKTLRASIGIGFGTTAYDAEQNGRIGLSHAKSQGGDCVYLVDQDRNITGPMGGSNELVYALNSSDARILEVSEETGLSGKNINRIMAMIQKQGNRVSAQEVAYYLQMTERSARRILGILEQKGYGKIVGEESLGRGRPKKIYELSI